MDDSFERAKELFVQGVNAAEAARLNEAERCFEASLALLPTRSSTLVNLGAVRMRLDKPEAALRALDQALALDAAQPDAWSQRGIVLAGLGKASDAMASFERALAIDASFMPALFHLGSTLNGMREHPRALTMFERLLAVDARHAQAWFCHGQTLQTLDRHADASLSYDRALALDPVLPQAWLNQAGIHKGAGRIDDARAAYCQALAHGAEPALVQFYLAALDGDGAPAQAPRGYVQGLFDDYAADFDTHLVDVLRYRGHERLVEVLQRAAPGRQFRRALDLGCGTGLCGLLLQPLAASVDGVDLSRRMLEQAERRGVYQRLVLADVTEHLAGTAERYDLIAAADVFTYLGSLDAVIAAAQRVLEPGGVLCFSVECAAGDEDVVLLHSLRYAHSLRHVQAVAQRHALTMAACERQPMREDQRLPVDALFVVLTR
jgi:predicted TPR repeat methyltransferase